MAHRTGRLQAVGRLDKGPPVITLDPAAGYVVLINTFIVEPENAEQLLTELTQATEKGMRQLPGFVSANLHVSQDNSHVANYVQWRSQADIDHMMADPGAQSHMARAAALATSFDPVYYTLRESISA